MLIGESGPMSGPAVKRTDIRDGALWVIQNKTGARLGIEITGELAQVITRIIERSRRAISAFLIQDENGQALTLRVLTRHVRWRRWIFSFGISGARLQPTQPGALTEVAGAQKPGYD